MKATIVLLADIEAENVGRKYMLEANRVGNLVFEMARLPHHISLKQPFIISNLIDVEMIFDKFCSSDWHDFDTFFFDNLHIADKYCFITTLHDEAIGFVSWDPRNMPEYVEIGHNCIIQKYKGNGYGKIQLKEALNRISQNDVKKKPLFMWVAEVIEKD